MTPAPTPTAGATAAALASAKASLGVFTLLAVLTATLFCYKWLQVYRRSGGCGIACGFSCSSPFRYKLGFQALTLLYCVLNITSLRRCTACLREEEAICQPGRYLLRHTFASETTVLAFVCVVLFYRAAMAVHMRQWRRTAFAEQTLFLVLLVLLIMAAVLVMAAVHDANGGRNTRSVYAEVYDALVSGALLVMGVAFLAFGRGLWRVVHAEFPQPRQHAPLKASLRRLNRGLIFVCLLFFMRAGFLVADTVRMHSRGRGGGSDDDSATTMSLTICSSLLANPRAQLERELLPIVVPLVLVLWVFCRHDDVVLLQAHINETIGDLSFAEGLDASGLDASMPSGYAFGRLASQSSGRDLIFGSRNLAKTLLGGGDGSDGAPGGEHAPSTPERPLGQDGYEDDSSPSATVYAEMSDRLGGGDGRNQSSAMLLFAANGRQPSPSPLRAAPNNRDVL